MSAAAGARAAAAAATEALGDGTTATLRMPAPPLAATPAEELGLPSPEFHDVALTPCVVRFRPDGTRELLVSATTLEAALGVADADAATQALVDTAFVQIGGALLLLRKVQPLVVHDCAYLYRLLLREADAEAKA